MKALTYIERGKFALRFTELKNLVNTRMLANKKYFVTNQLLDSTYSVLSAVVNSLH